MKVSDLLASGGVKAPDSSLSTIFSEEPVDLTTFVQDRKYLANPPLSSIQYDAVRHIEQIYRPEHYQLMADEFGPYWEPVRFINFADLMWGKGSGKDHVSRICLLRIAYLLLCLKSPQDYFSMPAQDTIHMLNVASSSAQATTAFFEPLRKAVRRGWFADQCESKMNMIVFNKNVEALSGHSDAESQEGMNLILGVADEIDAFRTKDELILRKGQRDSPKTAEGILTMLRTSGSTRFETYKNVRISYPRYLGSMIMRLRDAAEADVKANPKTSRYYYSGPHATWDVKPTAKREQFDEDYAEDPVMARAKYECKPARAATPWFRDEDAVASIFEAGPDREGQPIEVEYTLSELVDAESGHRVRTWVPKFHFAPWFQPLEGARYAVHGDIGIKHDRAGVAMSHVASWTEVVSHGVDSEGGTVEMRETRPVVRNDFTLSFTADPTSAPQREVQVRWYRDLLSELLRRGFRIVLYTFDGYQSTDSRQIIESRGIETDLRSMDRDSEPWRSLRDVVYDNRMRAPYRPILFQELLSLEQTPQGKVDHPPGGSKDEADAFCGSVVGALSLGGSEGDEVAAPASVEFPIIPSPFETPVGLSLKAMSW